MMKLIVAGAVAFVLGVGGGTGFVVMRAPAPVQEAAVAKADSTHAPATAAAGESAPHAAATPAAAGGAPAPGGAARGAEPAPAAAVASATPSTRPVVETVPDVDAEVAETYGQMARILATMKPADAVKIMAHLSDDQVEGVLRSLGVRPAAILLAQMPVERAAALSRRLMIPLEPVKP